MSADGASVESWTSTDGLHWQRQASQTVPDDVIGTFGVEGLSAVGDRLVAVGTYPQVTSWTSRRAAAWMSPIPAIAAIDTPPAAAVCDSIPSTLAGAMSIAPQDRSRCFGRRTLHLTGWQTESDSDQCGLFAPKEALVQQVADATRGCGPALSVAAGPNVRTLVLAFAPSTNLRTAPPDGHEYTATGHFDDSIASHCPSVSTTVADCKAIFVATSYKRVH